MRIHRFVAVFLLPIFGVVPVLGIQAPESSPAPNFDIRLPAREADRAGFRLKRPDPMQHAAAEALRRSLPGVVLRWDDLSAAPHWLAAAPGSALAAPSADSPEEAARSFLREHAVLFGIRGAEMQELRLGSRVSAPKGGSRLYFEQWIRGIEVFGGRVNVNLSADGSIRSLGARLYPVGRLSDKPTLSAYDAVVRAARDVYQGMAFSAREREKEDTPEQRTIFEKESFGEAPQARLVFFPEATGARLAWEIRLAEKTKRTSYVILLDAHDGTLLFRHNETLHAEARVLDATKPSPQTEEASPNDHRLITLPGSTPQSPNGYLDGAGVVMAGNNATSHLRYWTEEGLAEASGAYDYLYNTANSGLTNAWYWANRAHDLFYDAGFTEEAGNFQADNFGLGGVGGDALGVVHWISGGRNNAYFTSSVDGEQSTMNFFWVNCLYCGDHDGYPENGGERHTGFMREVVFHEYGHGVSIRMVGGPADDGCLRGTQSGGMGEGWSDLFGATFFDDPQIGDHFYEGSGWMRDLRNDLSYEEVCRVGDSGCQVHGEGMIWSGTLWNLRQSMMALDPVSGRRNFERIVVEGLASTVCFPSMLDARDGILDADTALFASAHHKQIWHAFAERGMGSAAWSAGAEDTAPIADYTVPSGMECTAPSAAVSLTATASASNEVRLDYDASGAAAVEIWREDLDNMLDRPIKIAATNDVATFLDDGVQGGRSYRYHLVSLGDGGISCRSPQSSTADVTATGVCTGYPYFEPGLVITDGDPGCALTLSWNAASASCDGEPVVYNVYAAEIPGFEPSDRNLVARTVETTVSIIPDDATRAHHYLVLAQHGTLEDEPNHEDRGSAQRLQWVAALPTLGRSTVQTWDFDSGPDGWVVNNSDDPAGGWVLTGSPQPTRYGGSLLAPDEPAGGTGQSWVTGDDGNVPTSITEQDLDGEVVLSSPVWDGTGGATIFSFDYWAHQRGFFAGGLRLDVDNGIDTVRIFDIGWMTAQRFETAGRYGWQRFEVDLAQYVSPSATMSVDIRALPNREFSEFGVDNVRVESATVCARSALVVDGVTIDDSPAGWGNGNGVAEPGETLRLLVNLRNDGSADAVAPVGRIISAPAGVVIHEESDDFPDLPVGQVRGSNNQGFTLTLPDVMLCDDAFEIGFELTDSAGTLSHDRAVLEAGTTFTDTVFADDFETDQGWTVQGATVGQGMWERGTPVAGGLNPTACFEGQSCFVTGLDGSLLDHDVDGTVAELFSPLFDLTGYKRTRLEFALYFQDDSSDSDFWQDYGRYAAYVDDGLISATSQRYEGGPTSGWESRTLTIHNRVPSVPDMRLYFSALDRNEYYYGSATDSTVEMAIDDVRVIGDRQECAASSVSLSPNGIGPTLRIAKSGVGGENGELTWTPSPVDGTHDAPAYYELYVSDRPDAGFIRRDTTTTTSIARSFEAGNAFYRITAVNSAGVSPDHPTP